MPIDYKKYPNNWETIRERILKREQHKCKFCGVTNYAAVWRCKYKGKEAYQLSTGETFYYPSGVHIGNEFNGEIFDVQPLTPGQTQSIKIVLTIAHLDHDPENHEVKDDRLAALCQKCHLAYDAPEKARKRKEELYNNSLFPLNKK